jgi:AcrR family transcriptional regulator
MKRQIQVEESKTLIADAFLTLLSRKPYDAVTLAEIAEEADISRMTIHRHFKCKENILIYQIKKVMKMVRNETFIDEEPNLKSEILMRLGLLKSLPHAKLLVHCDEIITIIYDIRCELEETLLSKYITTQPDKYMIQFIKCGVNSMIKEWLNSDFDISPEELTDKLLKVLKHLE